MIRRKIKQLAASLLFPLIASGQQPVPTVTLTTSSATLQLPGSVTLKATVAPPQAAGGMPSGSVKFFNAGSNLLGTAVLAAIPSTQNFSAAPIAGSFGVDPVGIFTLNSAATPYSVLGVLDLTTPNPTTGIIYPQLTIYSGKGASLFQTAAVYSLVNSNMTNFSRYDSFGIGDFTHDGVPDVVIHGVSSQTGNPEYYVLPGKSDGTFDTTSTLSSTDTPGLSCFCSFATEAITVDDFDGDGYADIGYTGTSSSNGQSGVALNTGSKAPGTFTTFAAAPALVTTSPNEFFTSVRTTSGHFTSSGRPDLVLTGYSSVNNGFVALYLNQGVTNGTLSFASAAMFSAGYRPMAIATADFRANGTTDVVVANENSDFTTGNIQVLFGDGKGSLTTSSTVALSAIPNTVSVADVNKDGFPDIITTGTDGSVHVLLNDGKGSFATATLIGNNSAESYLTVGDFNGDGLSDLAAVTYFPITDGGTTSTDAEFLNSASSETSFATPAKSLPAGSDNVTATFPADTNFGSSTSTGVPITVTQTLPTLTWAAPGAMEYGVPLGGAQLNATADVPGAIAYAPAAGTVLAPGANSVTATFVPTDTFDYAGATATQSVTVTAPSISGIAPASANLGDADTTVTITGQGLVNGAVAEWSGTALATTWVNLNQLMAVIPASLLTAAGTHAITVVDPKNVAVAGSQTFTIAAGSAVAKATAPATVDAGQNSSITLSVNPYPVAITATLTLSFTPDPPNTAADPTVLFPNNTTTEVIQIPANSTAAIPAIDFSTGSTAGTITLTVQLSAGGANVTPSSLAPVSITVPAGPPSITSASLTRNGTDLTLAIRGLSPTRTMTQATFHFTAAAGKSLKTTDLTVDLTTAFSTWYQSASSVTFGTTFLYTQPFTLSTDASSVGSVTVTLSNGAGSSQPATAQ